MYEHPGLQIDDAGLCPGVPGYGQAWARTQDINLGISPLDEHRGEMAAVVRRVGVVRVVAE